MPAAFAADQLLFFIQNASSLAAVVVAYALIQWNCARLTAGARNALLGMAFGLGAVLSMTNPIELAPGLIFDSRTVMLGLAGPFGAAQAAAVAALVAGGYRFFVIGGQGALVGTFGIVLCAVVGIGFARYIRRLGQVFDIGHLFPLGLVIVLSTFLPMALLPTNLAQQAFTVVGMPLSISIVFGTLLLGTLLVHERRRHRIEKVLVGRERQLAQRDAMLRSQRELAPFGILIADEKRRIQSWNRRFAEMWGLSEALLRSGDNRGVLDGILAQVADSDAYAARVDHLYRHLDEDEIGETLLLNDARIIERFSKGIRGHGGEPWGRVWFYLDVTDRVQREVELKDARDRMEAQARALSAFAEDLDQARIAALNAQLRAEAANRAKSAFLAAMSHELRTPLNAVIGFSEIIRDRLYGADHAKYVEYAADIHRSGRHLLDMIDDILDLAKVEADRMDLHEASVDLAGVIETCVRMMRPKADAGESAMTAVMSAEIGRILADERRLTQVVLNLLSNAVKFTPAGGQIAVTVNRDDRGRVSVAVSDTGVGIAPEDMEAILEPFGQGRNASGRNIEGTGLGLPLTRRLLELHGGALEIVSRVGEGTTVTAVLPADRVVASAA